MYFIILYCVLHSIKRNMCSYILNSFHNQLMGHFGKYRTPKPPRTQESKGEKKRVCPQKKKELWV